MGTVTLSTRRSRLAALQGVSSGMTIPTTLSTELTDFVQRALRHIYAFHRWPFMETKVRVRLYAATKTGTVSVAAGGTSWTGVGTAFPTTWTLANGQAKIRSEDIVYRVSTISSATALATTDAAVAAISGKSHMVYMDEYSLLSTMETIDSAMIDASADTLTPMTPAEMDQNKALATDCSHPTFFCARGVDSSGYTMIEVWPIPGYDEILQVKGTKVGTIPSGASDTDDIPTRFSDVVDEVAKTYLYEYFNDPRYSIAKANSETMLVKMVQQAATAQGPRRVRLDPKVFGKSPTVSEYA